MILIYCVDVDNLNANWQVLDTILYYLRNTQYKYMNKIIRADSHDFYMKKIITADSHDFYT